MSKDKDKDKDKDKNMLIGVNDFLIKIIFQSTSKIECVIIGILTALCILMIYTAFL